MGWFALLAFKMCELTGFSSPSGDGLVLIDCSKAENYFAFSSPGGVGLVHFTRTILLSSICFRPRVGMGWFGWGICKEYFYGLFFVPAWGWGGSSLMVANIPEGRKFSSPLGDGLVRTLRRL